METLLIRENHRFMAEIREALQPGYLLRAAGICLTAPGLSISSLVPVNDRTDGPAGAFALYRLCEKMGHQAVIITDTGIAEACRIDSLSIAGKSFEPSQKRRSCIGRHPQGW